MAGDEARAVATTVCIFVGIFLIGMATAVESSVTYALLPFVTSAFSAHSLMSTVQIVSNSARTIVYPVTAKVADVFGRLESLCVALVLTMLGYLCMGLSVNVTLYCLSQACYVLGQAATSITLTLIIADHSTLVNRVLISCIPNLPYLVSGFIGPPVAEKVLSGPGWRFGIFMWLLILPVVSSFLLATLLVLRIKEHRQKKRQAPVGEEKSRLQRLVAATAKLDLLGLLLFGSGLVLTLVPFTLNTDNESAYFVSRSFLVPLCCGVVVLGVFGVYDVRWAKYPILPARMLRHSSVLAACISGFFYFLTFYIFDLYVTSYYQVAKDASLSQANYINSIFSFVSTGAGICSGLVVRFLSGLIWKEAEPPLEEQEIDQEAQTALPLPPPPRVFMGARKALRLLLMLGMVVFLLGIICFTVCIKVDASITWIVVAMVTVSVGGGLYTTPLMSASQACVCAEDLASCTALVLTSTLLGGSVGSAISGAIWTNRLYSLLDAYLPPEYKHISHQISEDMSVALSFAQGTPVRTAINAAYTDTVATLCYVAVGTAVIVVIATSFIQPHKHIPSL